MNISNFLTLSRFFLSFLIVFLLLWRDGRWAGAALAVFLAASLTDYWDGRLARERNEVTAFGKLIKGDDVLEKIATTPTQPGDRPVKRMNVESIKIVPADSVK